MLGTVVVLYGTVYCTMYNTQYTAEEYKIAAVSCAANANIVIVSKVLTSYNWGSLFTVKKHFTHNDKCKVLCCCRGCLH